MICVEGRAKAFLALRVDARSDGLEVFNRLQESKALGQRENPFILCGKKSAAGS